jgi:hypothetical protein
MSWKNPKAYVSWKSDKGVKTRKSSYTARFHAKYPGVDSLSAIATATGIPKRTLEKVYNRGMAAWRTGHRPGASQQAWGMARVHSFVLHGKTYRTADADLAKSVKGGAWFGKSDNPDSNLAKARTAEQTAQAAQTGIAAATTIGLVSVAASGPALPIVLGLGIVAAAGYRIYAQNGKLADLFKRTANLSKEMTDIIGKIEKSTLNDETLKPSIETVKTDIIGLQKTIGTLIGPEAFNELKSTLGEAGKTRDTLSGRMARFARIAAPGGVITRFNEQLIQLGLDFSIVLGKFAMKLDTVTPQEAQQVVQNEVDTTNVPVNTAAAASGAAASQSETRI